MTKPLDVVPVTVFAYARPRHLARTLDCLRVNGVPKLIAFSDGARAPDKQPAVDDVRRLLRTIDWCEVEIHERQENLGLGRSILTGVTEVLSRHEATLVYEDDLICVPGTYGYLASALRHYRDRPEVMSVTGWTHPRINPVAGSDQPYFDARAECWVWGTWQRAWQGMLDRDAKTLMEACRARGMDVAAYGPDLVQMAETELARNIWAVRLLFHHFYHGGLCLRPPWSMVEHIGFDADATNASDGSEWSNPPLRPCPPLPRAWPEPRLHRKCQPLWFKAYAKTPPTPSILHRARGFVRRCVRFGARFIAGKRKVS
jgi:hypothetical protein